MKRLFVLIMAATIAISSTVISYAGEWKQDSIGWRYQNDDGSYIKNNWLTNEKEFKYHFDSNGYMQTGIIEVDGVKHYLGEDGCMLYNGDTPEGHKIDSDGQVIDENTHGIIFSILCNALKVNKESDLLICAFKNEGKIDFVVDPTVEIDTDGNIKKLRMYDSVTNKFSDEGLVTANSNVNSFAFILSGLQPFSVNEKSTVTFHVYNNSYANSFNCTIPISTYYRIHLDD